VFILSLKSPPEFHIEFGKTSEKVRRKAIGPVKWQPVTVSGVPDPSMPPRGAVYPLTVHCCSFFAPPGQVWAALFVFSQLLFPQLNTHFGKAPERV
jgi:hypothetical protein